MTICLLACLAFSTLACNTSGPSSKPKTDSITLSEEAISLEVYSEYTLTAETNVSGDIVWTTSDATVATVDGGKVSALKVGTATITATAGSASATCVVTVTGLSTMPVLTLDCNDVVEMLVGSASRTISATVTYKGELQDCEFDWSSDNENVVTVEDGVITPVGVGSTTVSVVVVYKGEILTKDITVIVKHDEQLIVSKNTVNLTVAKVNDSDIIADTFTAVAYKQGAVNSDVTFTCISSDENVATASEVDGVVTVTAVGKGTCQITVKYTSAQAGEVSATVSVVVSLSQVEIDEVIELEYLGADTAFDVTDLDLQGEYDGVYFNGVRIDAEGKLDAEFVETNKDTYVAVEIRTNAISYAVRLYIASPFVAKVTQGGTTDAMPTYDGDVTALGYENGTTVYQVAIADLSNDFWNKRLVTTVNTRRDYVKIDFVLSASVGSLSIWPGNDATTFGYYAVSPENYSVQSDANPNREIFILNKDGNRPATFSANRVYTLYFAIDEGETNIQISIYSLASIYFANIECLEASEVPDMPAETTPEQGAGPVVPVDPHPEYPAVSQGDGGAAMPTYDGTDDLGFPMGTQTIYKLETSATTGWDNRLVARVDSTKDLVKIDVVFSQDIGHFTMWSQVIDPTGSYMITRNSVTPSAEAQVQNRKVFILNAENRVPSALSANTHYTIYFFLAEGETYIHISAFADLTIYVANIECVDADAVPYDPTLPPPTITQGEGRYDMPIYSGDVTSLGFASGTTVYEVVGPQSNASDVKLVAQVDASQDFAKIDFVLSASTTSLGLWITAENKHLGYYTLKANEFTTDGSGDPSRTIFVTDKDGNDITAFEANKVYTLYVGLDGREKTIQLSTWSSLTIYAANFGHVNASEVPENHRPEDVTPGKEISILFIGNSFSDDTEAYVVEILLELGYTTINVGNMYIGGCDIETHYNNIMNNAKAYDFRMRTHNGRKYTEYVPSSVGGEKQTLAFAIAYKNWDIISLQQGSALSGVADSYANLSALKAEVQNKATNADVKFVFNMTWAYQQDSTHSAFPTYNSDQMTMYNAIVGAVQAKVDFTVVPNGTAVQNARTSFVGDTLTLAYHLAVTLQVLRLLQK